jgi:hypothetical protein
MALVNSGTAASFNYQDLALNSQNERIQTTALYMIEAGSFFTHIPIIDKKLLATRFTRITGGLQTPTWMPLNNGTNVQNGPDPEWQDEEFYGFRDAIDIDKKILQDESQINDPFELRIETYVKGVSYDMNYKFIQNKHIGATDGSDPRVDPNSFIGIRERLDNTAKFGNSPQCKISAGGINLGASGTGADGLNIEFLIDRLFARMGSPTGEGIILVMSDLTMASFDRTVKKAQSGGGFRYTEDAFDRTVTKYKNAIIMSCGYAAPTGPRGNRVQSTIISPFETEDGVSDTGGAYTSIYAFKPSSKGLFGWQFEPLAPSKPRLLDDGCTFRVNFDGGMGLQNEDPYALGRIYGVAVDGGS